MIRTPSDSLSVDSMTYGLGSLFNVPIANCLSINANPVYLPVTETHMINPKWRKLRFFAEKALLLDSINPWPQPEELREFQYFFPALSKSN